MIGALLHSPILSAALKDIGDDLLENGLAIIQRAASKVAPVEVKQVERDHHDLSGTSHSFCSTEKSVVPSAPGTTASPSMIAEPALTCQASEPIFPDAAPHCMWAFIGRCWRRAGVFLRRAKFGVVSYEAD